MRSLGDVADPRPPPAAGPAAAPSRGSSSRNADQLYSSPRVPSGLQRAHHRAALDDEAVREQPPQRRDVTVGALAGQPRGELVELQQLHVEVARRAGDRVAAP